MAEARTRVEQSRQAALGIVLGLAGALAALAPDWRIPAAFAGAVALCVIAVWTLARPYRWLALFFALALLAPPLPIELGSTGPHLALFAAALGVLGLLLRNQPLRLPDSSAGRPALVYLATLALSAVPALLIHGPGAAAASLVRTTLFAIAVVAYLALRHGEAEPDARRWIRGLLALGFLTALLGCIDFALQLEPPAGYGVQMVWLPGAIVRRAQGVFYDAAQFGNVCAFFLVGVAAIAVRGRNLASAPVLAITALTLAAALIFSFSRGAMLSAFAGLVALAILERRSWASHARTAAGALAIALAAPGAAFLAAPEFTSSYLLRFGYTAWRSVGDPLRALDVRADTWARLLETLADHPARLLLGAGYKTLALPSAAGGPLIVDNQWLTALGETGLLGVAALAILIAAILHGSWRAARSAHATAALLGAWSFCFWAGQLVHMLFVDLMTYWRVLPVYLAVLALAEREAERRPT